MGSVIRFHEVTFAAGRDEIQGSYGSTIHFRMPGGIRGPLWEPKYKVRGARRARPAKPRMRAGPSSGRCR